MWGGRPRHERKTKPNNNRGGRRRTFNEERQTVHCKLVREHRTYTTNRKNKNHQEKTRLPSTALLALGTLVKTVLILARRVSLELLSQPVADAAVAARLVLNECEIISHNIAVRIRSPIKNLSQEEEMGNRRINSP